MRETALRVLLLAVLCATALAVSRVAPTRPAAPATAAVGAAKDKHPGEISVAEFARRSGLELSWPVPQKRILLKNAAHRVELEVRSRLARVDGVTVFLGEPTTLAAEGVRLSRIDADRLLGPLVRAHAQPMTVPGLTVIAIDPGHGGEDAGTTNVRLGVEEKAMTLDVSKRLKACLEAKGYRVVMTREHDAYIPKAARAIFANQAKADLFISVHFNGERSGKVGGTEVFTFAPQFQRSTDFWGSGGVDDSEPVAAPVNRHDGWSAVCAHALQKAFVKSLRTNDRGQKIAHWATLRLLNCPAVLVEPAFLTSEIEGPKIATPAYRQQIAEAIAEGVAGYAAVLSAQRK